MDHDWVLSAIPWTEPGGCVTIFSWKCAYCSVEVLVAADDPHVGSHGAWAYKPSEKRLLVCEIMLVCEEQNVRSVLES